MVLQGLVDHSGKVHDVRIFRKFGLFSAMRIGTFTPMVTLNINGVAILPGILGDASYSLFAWLMKSFTWMRERSYLTILCVLQNDI